MDILFIIFTVTFLEPSPCPVAPATPRGASGGDETLAGFLSLDWITSYKHLVALFQKCYINKKKYFTYSFPTLFISLCSFFLVRFFLSSERCIPF